MSSSSACLTEKELAVLQPALAAAAAAVVVVQYRVGPETSASSLEGSWDCEAGGT